MMHSAKVNVEIVTVGKFVETIILCRGTFRQKWERRYLKENDSKTWAPNAMVNVEMNLVGRCSQRFGESKDTSMLQLTFLRLAPSVG